MKRCHLIPQLISVEEALPQEEKEYIIKKLDAILNILNNDMEAKDRIKKAIIFIDILKTSIDTGWRY